MAAILPFPAARRIGFVRRQVNAFAGYKEPTRTRAIENVLNSQWGAMAKSIGPDAAEEYVDQLRAEIYARMPRRSPPPSFEGGAA